MTGVTHPPLPPKSVAVVLGTRPEIIKLAPVIRALGPAALVVHTGQHFEPGLSTTFFDAFGVPAPDVTLRVGGDRATQIGQALEHLDPVLEAGRPRVVVVHGDTNSTVAGALAANARGIPLVHVEAGLRSFDRRMPEEHNRVIADHLADLCCAPTEVNVTNLAAESVPPERILRTGNTIVEAATALLPPSGERARLLAARGLEPTRYVLSTFHRPENVDDAATLDTILTALAGLPVPVVLPVHPRTRSRIEANTSLGRLAGRLGVCEPLGYQEFLALAAECALLVSDSGGVQEEASILKRPVVVVRRSTERPEVLGTFATRVEPGPEIASACMESLTDIRQIHAWLSTLPTPYGDGSAARRVADAIVTRAGAGDG